MKAFRVVRSSGQVVLAVELSLRDIVRILLGRELTIREKILPNEKVVLRNQHAYDILNCSAPPT